MTARRRCGLLLACAVVALACAPERDPLPEIRRLQRAGRFAPTVEPLRALVDEDPSRAEAQLLLGTALLRTGEAGLAVWPLRRATESREHAVEAGLLLAQAMLQSRTAPDAITACDRVLEIEPENVDALVLRMQGHLASGGLEPGLADAERVLALDPDNLVVLVPRVTALIALDRIDDAKQALETARARIEAEEDQVESEVRARLCIATGLFAFEDGRREEAESQYAACLEAFPTEPVTVSESVAFQDRNGRPERATEILEQAAERSSDPFFRMALAQRMGMLGKPEEQERLMRADAEERSSASSWFALADYYVHSERFDEALAAFEASLAASRDPSPMLRFAYADTLVQARRFDEARRAAEEIDQPMFRSLIRGRILLEEGNAAEALEALEAGIRLWPNNAAGRFLAGQAAERLGDFERAASEYRESVRANAGETPAGLHLARLYTAHEDYAAALGAIQRYVQTHPRDPEGYVAAIRIAHRAERHGIAAEGLERLSALPGQAATAAVEEAGLLAAGRGAQWAVEAIEGSGLDLRDPAHEAALRSLLTQLAALGAHERAERLVAQAIAAHPEHAGFYELRGRVLRAAGASPERTREAFQRALALEPARASALAELAALAAAEDDRAGALSLYQRAARADPDEPGYPLAAAKLHLEAGELDDAERLLAALIERHPREAGATNDLARILAERGELERAAQLAERAAWLRLPEATATKAWIRGLDESGES